MKLFCCLFLFTLAAASAADMLVVRLPQDALQPRTAALGDGTTAVVYFHGDPKAGDVKITTLDDSGKVGGTVQVSTLETRAVAMGTVRGPAIAVGARGTRHVLWHGTAGSAADGKGSALYYVHMNGGGMPSEVQDMMGGTTALDGGAAVAANAQGHVWLVWHGLPAGGKGEPARRLYLRHSLDNGATFTEPWAVKGEDQGICGCCGLAAVLLPDGSLHVLYRAAENVSQRGARLIHLPADANASTVPVVAPQDQWNMPGCPMTTAAFLQDKAAAVPAWVTQYQLSFQDWAPQLATPAEAPRNHPRMARNGAGETLLAWTEGATWGKGGELVAQLFSAHGTPQGKPTRRPLFPWQYGACATLADGRLVLLY